MSGRRALPVGTILIVLAILLATMGVGYGLWSQVLTINGIVHTGEVDAALSVDEVDEGPQWDDNGFDEDEEANGKDVAECSYQFVDPYTLNVTITNGYPSYNCWLEFDVHNTGTIPVIAEQPVLTYPPELTVELYGCYHDGDANLLTPVPAPQLDPVGMGPGDSVAFCWIRAHVDQEAAELATYNYQATVCVHQWNEAASATCGPLP